MFRHRIAFLTLFTVAGAAGIAFSADVPAQDLDKIRLAAPHVAPAKPRKPRKLLVFSKADGYIHESIPWGAGVADSRREDRRLHGRVERRSGHVRP